LVLASEARTVSLSSGRSVQVDDFGIDAIGGQRFSGFQSQTDADRIGHDGHVLALTHDAGLADGQNVVVQFGQFERTAIDQFVFRKTTGSSLRMAALSRPLASEAS
jgi:hypothetical protein